MPIAWTVSTQNPRTAKVDVLVVPVWANKKITAALPDGVKKDLQQLMRNRQWHAAAGTAAFFVQRGKIAAPFVALIGLGSPDSSIDRLTEAVRRGVGDVVLDARRHGLMRVGIVLQGLPQAALLAVGAAEAVTMANYSFTEFSKRLVRQAKRQAIRSGSIFVDQAAQAATKKALSAIGPTMAGTNLARTLVNRPAGHMSPKSLVDEAQRIAGQGKNHMALTVFNRAQAYAAGFTAFLAVAKGSMEEPYVIHLQYVPPDAGERKKIALVGKGVTFDSGGLSLKPAEYMEDMKIDMAGAATVLGVFEALLKTRPNVEVHGIICACENMPSGNAYRPGDIVTAMNGKTIEVLNTDAEGRITLADALTYAARQKPDAIIDLATLTGASMVGLGETVAGLWGTDDSLVAAIQAAARVTGEQMATMPMPEEYKPLIESRVADLRNIATSKFGGGITAAMFLREFTNGVPWAHLDIAGPAYYTHPYFSYLGLGASGYGVRTLVQYLAAVSDDYVKSS